MREFIQEILADPRLTIHGYLGLLILADLFMLPSSLVCFYGAARYGFPLAVGIIAPTHVFTTTLAFTVGRKLFRPLKVRIMARFGDKLEPRWLARWKQRSLFRNLKEKIRQHSDLTVFSLMLVTPKGLSGYVTGLTTDYPFRRYLVFSILGIAVNVTLKVALQSTVLKAYLFENITLVLISVALGVTSFSLARWAKKNLKNGALIKANPNSSFKDNR